MSPDQFRAAAMYQLNLVLGFFTRAESRLALVLGIDLSMLALLATSAPPVSKLSSNDLIAFIPAALIALSLWNVWDGFFPDTDTARLERPNSLIFFGSVDKRTESAFVQEYGTQSDDEYVRDLLGQVWANSRILSRKFECLKSAFRWMLAAILPWIVVLGVFAASRVEARSLMP